MPHWLAAFLHLRRRLSMLGTAFASSLCVARTVRHAPARDTKPMSEAAAAAVRMRIIRSTDPVEDFMLRYAVIFFIIAIIAAFFGFGGIATGATEIAKILFFIFIVIFLATLLLGVFRR
jgi:uncharacterized membrane protein YtjA (UPF0391 family)